MDPLGYVKVLGSYDKISGPDYRNFACSYPQQSLVNLNLELLCQTVGKSLYGKGAFGYMSLDLLAFQDVTDETQPPLFWAIGLDCFINNFSASCVYFYFLVNGECEQ